MAVGMFLLVTGCTGPKQGKRGILVMAHGGEAAWNEAVEATVAPLRDKYPIEIAFGMARTSTIRQGVERLQAQGVRNIAVVRMFISGDSFLEPTEYILGLRSELPPAPTARHAGEHPSGESKGSSGEEYGLASEEHGSSGEGHGSSGEGHGPANGGRGPHMHMEPPERIGTEASFVLSREGVGASPLVDQILVDRVRALSTDPAKESVLILAHGPADEAENERWLAHMRLRVQRIHELGPFRHVECETLREDWPDRRAEAERRIRAYVEAGNRNGGHVIVVPFRIAGLGPYKDVLKGLDYVADGRGFCPHPHMTRWIERTAESCFARIGR